MATDAESELLAKIYMEERGVPDSLPSPGELIKAGTRCVLAYARISNLSGKRHDRHKSVEGVTNQHSTARAIARRESSTIVKRYADNDLSATLVCGATPAGIGTDIGDGEKLTGEQIGNAQIIYQVGAELGIPVYGEEIAIATAAQESRLINLTKATNYDSLGLLQQHPAKAGAPRPSSPIPFTRAPSSSRRWRRSPAGSGFPSQPQHRTYNARQRQPPTHVGRRSPTTPSRRSPAVQATALPMTATGRARLPETRSSPAATQYRLARRSPLSRRSTTPSRNSGNPTSGAS